MPIYDFVCDGGHLWNEMRKMADIDNPAHCPKCKRDTRRLISLSSFKIQRNPPSAAFDERHGGKYPLPREDAEIY